MTIPTRPASCCLLLACLLTAGLGQAKPRKKKSSNTGQFAYYMLVLSYAPDFCAQSQGNKSSQECGAGRKVGFVVHGFWPQGETSRGPENCGPASPVSQAIVQATLSYIPTASLIQHEWATHGTCSGLSAQDYFAALRKARDSVKLPPDLDQPSQNVQTTAVKIESEIAAANSSVPATAIRTSCYRNNELQDVRVCFTKDLATRPCGPSAGECTAPSITLLPVR
jgi:ribonuclease T2